MARENNVVLLCLPPHCSHRLQPLDVTFMAPLSTYYQQEVRQWLATHPVRAVTIQQVAKLYGAAFLKAAEMRTAVNGFKQTGIYPFNLNIFLDHLFAPSTTADRPVPVEANAVQEGDPRPQVLQVDPATATEEKPAQRTCETVVEINKPIQTNIDEPFPNEPCCSKSLEPQIFTDGKPAASIAFAISPTHLMPPPFAERKKTEGTDKRKGKCAILTSSPYKTELESQLEEKKKETERKITSQKRKLTLQKRKLVMDDSNKPNKKTTSKPNNQKHKRTKAQRKKKVS
ncbi:hypothetical protein JTB14_000243 [Gonioctena quinquepunctata]|nr:hypothetical protein JTB14_000243 [Gonioctena quinquepunctata]